MGAGESRRRASEVKVSDGTKGRMRNATTRLRAQRSASGPSATIYLKVRVHDNHLGTSGNLEAPEDSSREPLNVIFALAGLKNDMEAVELERADYLLGAVTRVVVDEDDLRPILDFCLLKYRRDARYKRPQVGSLVVDRDDDRVVDGRRLGRVRRRLLRPGHVRRRRRRGSEPEPGENGKAEDPANERRNGGGQPLHVQAGGDASELHQDVVGLCSGKE